MSSKPALVNRRVAERRRGDRRKPVDFDLSGFIRRCLNDGVKVDIQDQRQLITGQILAENEEGILVRSLNQNILLFRHSIVSIARAV